MKDFYRQIVLNLRSLLEKILEPRLDLEEFLSTVARAAKQLSPGNIEARVYEVDFIENYLYLRTSTQVDVCTLRPEQKRMTIIPHTITGDAIIENRVIVATREDGYANSRFSEGEEIRAAFPIEFFDVDNPEGRTKYVLVVEKKDHNHLDPDIIAALKDFSILAGLAISIKDLRDALSQYYDENRNLVLTGRHATSIAHDIRSLNVGVGGFLTLALRDLLDSEGREIHEKARKYVNYARKNAAQVEALLRDFSQFSRANIELNRDTDLTEAVSEKIESLANRIDYGRIVEFKLATPKKETGFLVDRDWFGTVLENLVRNSVEACGGKTRITIEISNDRELVSVVFEDNCGGIKKEFLPDVFTPYRTTKKKGHGLGLANAKKVINDHGGSIRVDNCTKGARFIMEFPLDPG